jgi:hypothetical protein
VKFARRSANAEFDKVHAAHLAANQARRSAEFEVTARVRAVAAAREAVRAAATEDQLDGGTRTATAQRVLDDAQAAAVNPDPRSDPEVHRRVAERRESELHAYVRDHYHDVAEELLPHAAQAARRVEGALQAVITAADEWSAVEQRYAKLLTLSPNRSAQEVARPTFAAARDEINRALSIGINEPTVVAPMFLSDNRDDSGDDADNRDTIEAA